MPNILISGAASGIGAATARLFHRHGWAVGLLDMNGPALSALAAELGDAWHCALDVGDGDAVKVALAEFCERHGGQLRLLFNSAGVLHCGAFQDISMAEHVRAVNVNVLGLMQMTHAAFPFLRATANAQVINMSSASAQYGVPNMASYSASKFAVRGLTEALELEWRAHGIRVGDLMPLFVATPMVSGQRLVPPVMRRLSVHLSAEQVARAAWRQARNPKVHRPIGWQFKLMYWSGELSPSSLGRLVMGWLNRA